MKFTESLVLLTILGTLFVGVLLVRAADDHELDNGPGSGHAKTSPATGGRFSLRKMLDFEQFKRKFNKNYSSIAEEMARQRLFLARAFKAFTSSISYKYKRSSSCLKLNQMSDWTSEEERATFMKPDVFYKSMLNREDLDEEDSKILTEVFQRESEQLNHVEVQSRLKPTIKHDDGVDHTSATTTTGEDGPTRGKLADFLNIIQEEETKEVQPVAAAEQPEEAKSETSPTKAPSCLKKLRLPSFKWGMNVLDRVEVKLTNAIVKTTTAKLERNTDLPDEIFHDHRQCLGPPRRQRACGSCYIFSAIALYEWAFCNRYDGQRMEFSEQYVIDCGSKLGMEGCEGGFESEVGHFVRKYGFEPLNPYRYIGMTNKCPYDLFKNHSRASMGALRMDRPRMKLVPYSDFEQQLKRSPLLIVIRTGDDFCHYGEGVHEHKCDASDELHSMLLVGSGREDGYEYWLIRNSYGTDWGEEGYFKMRKDTKCLGRFSYGLTLEVFRKTGLSSLVGVHSKPKPTIEPYEFDENPNYNSSVLQKVFRREFSLPHWKKDT